MNENELEKWILKLIEENKLCKFYKCKNWVELKNDILENNNYECQHCKQKGIHKLARSVHHVQFVRKYPRLALSRTYTYQGVEYNNLIPLCEDCHNKVHKKGKEKVKGFINTERW